MIFGPSKERPILGDHPKAHIHEIRWISQIKYFKKALQFYGVLWEGYVMFSHESRRIFERPIARNGKPYVYNINHLKFFQM